jgi:cobalt-zinc-cadmium efflux system outer membrane protein
MNYVSWALALLLAVTCSSPCRAQLLTEELFLEDTLAAHPAIAAAEADVASSSGVRRQAGVLVNPEIAWEREDPDMAARQDTWRASWRLPFDGRRHRVAAADSAVAASRSELDAARLNSRLEMRSLFASWYASIERKAVLEANLERASRLAMWLRARAEQGEAAGVEARRLDLEVEVLEREVAAARAEALARRAAAAAWSDLVTGDVRPVQPLLPPPPRTAEFEDHPDLRALAHRAAAAEARHQLQRRQLEPPGISAGWLKIRDGFRSFDGPVLGVTWPLPVFDRNQGNRQAAAASADRVRSELEAARRRAAQRFEAALASYSDLYRVVVQPGAGVVEDDVVDVVFAAFEAGEASLTDVLDSLRATIAVQMARLETFAGALAAEHQLEAALGRPILQGGTS